VAHAYIQRSCRPASEHDGALAAITAAASHVLTQACTAYPKLRDAIDALITGSEPIRLRRQKAEESFVTLDPDTELFTELERNLYQRGASSLVSGGPDEEDEDDAEYSREAVAESIAMLDDNIALLIARDMLRLYELAAGPPDRTPRWPSQRWPDDDRA
jgi:hypothetical protein